MNSSTPPKNAWQPSGEVGRPGWRRPDRKCPIPYRRSAGVFAARRLLKLTLRAAFGLVIAAAVTIMAPGIVHADESAIRQKHEALRGDAGVLGRRLANHPESVLSDGVGRFQQFERGWILWHPATGAHAIHGAVYLTNLTLLGIPTVPDDVVRRFGYPVQDTRRSTVFDGWEVNVWQRGVMYGDRSLRKGGRQIVGPIYRKWRALYDAGVKIGLPLGGEKDGIQAFRDQKLIAHSGGSPAVLLDSGTYRFWKDNMAELGGLSADTVWSGSTAETKFTRASVRSATASVPIRVFFQNMALLVAPAGYNGWDRQGAIQRLIDRLRIEKYDLVGLAEVFSDGERDRIVDALADIYPPRNRSDGPDEDDLASDGGLLLLSRHPVLARHQTVFDSRKFGVGIVWDPPVLPGGPRVPRQMAMPLCRGADCLANKGVLHARVRIAGLPADLSVFLTHLQNDNEGGSGASLPVTLEQASVVRRFVEEHTASSSVALIMGDFNLNAFDSDVYGEFLRRMGGATDLWSTCGAVQGPGITSDNLSDFKPLAASRPVASRQLSSRRRDGKRIDYMFLWSPDRLEQNCNMRVVVERFVPNLARSAAGQCIAHGLATRRSCIALKTDLLRETLRQRRDLSDHYGLVFEQEAMTVVKVSSVVVSVGR